MALLELSDVRVSYLVRGRPPLMAVAGVTLNIDRGEIVALVGESGCGKSTLARAAVGLAASVSGSIVFDGHAVMPLGRRRRSRAVARLQLVFQNPFSSLNPRRSIGSQIGDAIQIMNLVPRKDRHQHVENLLREVQIPVEAMGGYPQQFSGGQRQRIAIARALAADPAGIVMDEPFAALDASAQSNLAELLVKLTKSRNVAILLISHDLAVVRHIANRVAVMYLGEIVEIGATHDLWASPKHPYTRALIRAIPRADGSGQLPEGLAGEVPNPAMPPTGCRFHPRCPFVMPRCRIDTPALKSYGSDRMAACWLLEDSGRSDATPTES